MSSLCQDIELQRNVVHTLYGNQLRHEGGNLGNLLGKRARFDSGITKQIHTHIIRSSVVLWQEPLRSTDDMCFLSPAEPACLSSNHRAKGCQQDFMYLSPALVEGGDGCQSADAMTRAQYMSTGGGHGQYYCVAEVVASAASLWSLMSL